MLYKSCMFGMLRVCLCLLVVISHLPGDPALFHLGFYAVRAFFVLSGFLLTGALQKVYHFDLGRFWCNRLLKLVPMYYLACLFTFLAVKAFPAEAGHYLPYWGADASLSSVLLNFSILPTEYPELGFRLVPPYWSVAVELQMYAVLFLVASRNLQCALASLSIAVVYHGACLYLDLGFGARYFAAPSALLSFSAGATMYFWVKKERFELRSWFCWAALACWVGNLGAAFILGRGYAQSLGYYLSTVMFLGVLVGLAGLTPSPGMARLDRRMGDLAYPLFLFHWLVGFLTALIIPEVGWRGWSLTLCSMPPLFMVAALIAWAHNLFIEPTRIRKRKQRTSETLTSLGKGDFIPERASQVV